jgi:hypothetical protein
MSAREQRPLSTAHLLGLWVAGFFAGCGAPPGGIEPGIEDGGTPAMDEANRADAAAAASDVVSIVAPDSATVSMGGGGDVRNEATDALPAGAGDLSVAAALQSFRWELPCQGADYWTSSSACPWEIAKWTAMGGTANTRSGLRASLTRTFGGRPDVTYAVKLRFRGLVETNLYSNPDGTIDQEVSAAPHFHVGGAVAEHLNWYSLQVSEPKQVYYLNAFHVLRSGVVFVIDYTATIQIRGGTTISFGMGDRNGLLWANPTKKVVPGVGPAPAPFNGQFIQVDVLSATPSR